MPKLNSASALEDHRKTLLSGRDPDKPGIAICAGIGCESLDNGRVIQAFKEEVGKRRLQTEVDIRATGCHGYCEKGPLVVIHPQEICYVEVTPEDVPEIVSETVLGKTVIDRLIYADPETGEKAVHLAEIPFYKSQKRLLFGQNTKIDPESIDDYLALGGYSALSRALCEMSPELNPGCR